MRMLRTSLACLAVFGLLLALRVSAEPEKADSKANPTPKPKQQNKNRSKDKGKAGKAKSGRPEALLRPLERTKEWELATLVVRGQVKELRSGGKGETSSKGRSLVVMMTVDEVLKGSSVQKQQPLLLNGWASGKKRQRYLPRVGEEVVVFLTKPRNGQYDLLVPSGIRTTKGDKSKAKNQDKNREKPREARPNTPPPSTAP
jgi:hypothetical protein